jgi:hypothetical protein
MDIFLFQRMCPSYLSPTSFSVVHFIGASSQCIKKAVNLVSANLVEFFRRSYQSNVKSGGCAGGSMHGVDLSHKLSVYRTLSNNKVRSRDNNERCAAVISGEVALYACRPCRTIVVSHHVSCQYPSLGPFASSGHCRCHWTVSSPYMHCQGRRFRIG